MTKLDKSVKCLKILLDIFIFFSFDFNKHKTFHCKKLKLQQNKTLHKTESYIKVAKHECKVDKKSKRQKEKKKKQKHKNKGRKKKQNKSKETHTKQNKTKEKREIVRKNKENPHHFFIKVS